MYKLYFSKLQPLFRSQRHTEYCLLHYYYSSTSTQGTLVNMPDLVIFSHGEHETNKSLALLKEENEDFWYWLLNLLCNVELFSTEKIVYDSHF